MCVCIHLFSFQCATEAQLHTGISVRVQGGGELFTIFFLQQTMSDFFSADDVRHTIYWVYREKIDNYGEETNKFLVLSRINAWIQLIFSSCTRQLLDKIFNYGGFIRYQGGCTTNSAKV